LDLSPINLTDIAVALVILFSGLFALFRGFVHEILSVASWVGAAAATLVAFPFAQPEVRKVIAIPLVADLAAGIAIFLPNSLQLMHRFRPNVDYRRIGKSAMTRFLGWRILQWHRLSPAMAVAAGLLLFISLKAINSGAETEFLYFQF